MKIAILSNVNVNTIIKKMSRNHEIYNSNGYGNWVREIVDLNSNLYFFKPSDIYILLDGEELFNKKDNLDECKEEMNRYISYIEDSLKNNLNISYFVSTIDIPQKKIQSIKENRKEKILEYIWYEKLCYLNDIYENFYIFELKNLIEEIGRENFYYPKLWYLGGMKFSLNGEKSIEKETNRYINAKEGKKKKCLILDLDNTLWGGIIGEDGLDKIALSDFKEGARYKDFQRRIKELKSLGNILAIVSKNNYEDAIEVFEKHPNMLLKEDDFVSLKINWNPKCENIKKLSEELNIGLDSFVFIDDNPVERESVKTVYPQVVIPEFPKDTSELEKFIIEIYKNYFNTLKILKEDANKTEMYKQNANREIAKKTASNIDDFLVNLNMKIVIWKANEKDVFRIAQLTQKTNQFNVTTKRYTENDIIDFINSHEYDVYAVSVKDKYGDNGNVSTLIIKKNDDKTAYLDTFLLSCRVMGRNIENQIMNYIENKLYKEGYTKLYTEYIPTAKNKPVKNLFKNLNYKLIKKEDNDSELYYIELKENNKMTKRYGEMIEL